MTKLTQFYEELYNMGAVLIAENRRLPGDTDAMVIEDNGEYAVFFDLTKLPDEVSELMAASHEWAHIVTGATYRIGATPAQIQWAENRALRKQIERLLPYEEIVQAVDLGFTECWSIAEFLGLPERFVRDAIAYYSGPCGLTLS